MDFHKIALSGLALAAFAPVLNAQDQRSTPQLLQRKGPEQFRLMPKEQEVQPKLMWPFLKIGPEEPNRVFLIPKTQGGKTRLIPYMRTKPFQSPHGPEWPYLKNAPPRGSFRLVTKPR